MKINSKPKKYLSFLLVFSVLILSSCKVKDQSTSKLPDYRLVDTPPVAVEFGCEKITVKECFENFVINHISKNLKYPEEAKKKNITGKVYVSLIINKQAQVTQVEVVKSSKNTLLDLEAVRLVSTIPDFYKPAMVDFKPVSVQYTIPITFKLKRL